MIGRGGVASLGPGQIPAELRFRRLPKLFEAGSVGHGASGVTPTIRQKLGVLPCCPWFGRKVVSGDFK